MLTAYKLHAFRHQMLHRFMMRFFKTMMEMLDKKQAFSDAVFHPVFLPIAQRHKKLIYGNCKIIYEEFGKISGKKRQELRKRMEEGLSVEKICKGDAKPVHKNELPEPLSTTIKEMFESLYTSVLRGKDEAAYVERYGSIRKHFEEFHMKNMEITLCPFCGISPVRTDAMMEYDHYLPKSLYPFHAVNLENLVPTCKDCNQTEKGAIDVINDTTGKLFYPYTSHFKGIDIDYIIESKPEIKDYRWSVTCTSRDGLNDETASWRTIYGIDSRYTNFAGNRADKWFKLFVSYAERRMKKGFDLETIKDFFIDFLDEETEHKENFLRKPAYAALFRDTSLLKAFEESKK